MFDGTITVDESGVLFGPAEGSFLLLGDERENFMSANGGDSYVFGAGGDDTLNDGRGDDTLDGGPGNDLYRIRFGADEGPTTVIVNADYADARLRYGDGLYLYIDVGDETDRVQIGLPDTFRFNDLDYSREDLIRDVGTFNGTTYNGGVLGNYFSETGRYTRIFGNEGDDTLIGGAGGDTILGGLGDDLIYGFILDMDSNPAPNAFRNILGGGGGSDTIVGGLGEDILNGGWGFDTLTGWDGPDRFYHIGNPDHGTDWVTDYSRAEGDVIEFVGPGASNGTVIAGPDDFVLHVATSPGRGSDDVAEVFVGYRPTGGLLWALVDAGDLESVTLRIGAETWDLPIG
jgi:Ca2+-binding RTX toxin-like protein